MTFTKCGSSENSKRNLNADNLHPDFKTTNLLISISETNNNNSRIGSKLNSSLDKNQNIEKSKLILRHYQSLLSFNVSPLTSSENGNIKKKNKLLKTLENFKFLYIVIIK